MPCGSGFIGAFGFSLLSDALSLCKFREARGSQEGGGEGAWRHPDTWNAPRSQEAGEPLRSNNGASEVIAGWEPGLWPIRLRHTSCPLLPLHMAESGKPTKRPCGNQTRKPLDHVQAFIQHCPTTTASFWMTHICPKNTRLTPHQGGLALFLYAMLAPSPPALEST